MKHTKYLFHVALTREKYKNRKKIHKIIQKLASKDIPMCKSLKIGLCKEGVYVLQSWVDGVDAEENIHNYSNAQQYEFGFQSGKILRDIHTIPALKLGLTGKSVLMQKWIKIKMYSECPIKFDGAEYIIEYMNSNRDLLKKQLIISKV